MGKGRDRCKKKRRQKKLERTKAREVIEHVAPHRDHHYKNATIFIGGKQVATFGLVEVEIEGES